MEHTSTTTSKKCNTLRQCKKCKHDLHPSEKRSYCRFCIRSFNSGVPSYVLRQMDTYYNIKLSV